jgi:D-beta-D-heptose 7-phosphate kinase/D-beta-D-heptose 1-phosphate adenosyltransferase
MTLMGKIQTRESRLRRVIGAFDGTRVIVVGDVMVDQYYWGTVKRISPEAPVPVVDVTGETRRLGGAANVAHNIRALGGIPLLCGVAARDAAGDWLLDELERLGIESSGIVCSEETPTTVKSRVVAHSQQIVRFDREKRGEPPSSSREALRRALKDRWGSVGGAVISDYAKGVVGSDLMETVRRLNRGKNKIPVAADPKSPDFRRYRGTTVITPNLQEALEAAGQIGESAGGMKEAGAALLSLSPASAILVTRGEDGMSLFRKGKRTRHIPTVAQEVYDVTGAGDTVVGTLTLALAAGAGIADAAVLANIAAGVVVGEFGTVPATQGQLLEALG